MKFSDFHLILFVTVTGKNILFFKKSKNIDLRYNKIRSLERFSLDSTYDSESVLLSGNQLNSIVNYTFIDCDSLKIINLDNKITLLCPNYFWRKN